MSTPSPNYIVRIGATPNDTDYSELWGMNNTGQTGGTADADIDAPEAWDISTGDSSIVVGVIDTGVNYNHPDLVDNAWINPGEIAGNGVDDDGNGWVDDVHGINAIVGDGDPDDDHDHGSHCSGTIGATGNNNLGVVGVNWVTSIAGCKFLDSGGSGSTDDAITCVDYFVDLKNNRGINIRVLSNSWGGGGFSQGLFDSIEAANAADILFVAAAGNSSLDNDSSPHYPSSYENENVFAIASTDHNDNTSSFSNFGATSVDLGAPGTDILSTVQGTGYDTFSGTSMATPHVAGAAALVWSVNPALLDTEVKQLLMDSGDDIGGNWLSGNRLNVEQALLDADPQPTFRVSVSPSSRTIAQNESTTYDVTVEALNGYTGVVDLSLSSTPALNATSTFNPSSIDLSSGGSGTSTLTISTDPNTDALDLHPEHRCHRRHHQQVGHRPAHGQPRGHPRCAATPAPLGAAIPDNDANGITDTITVNDGQIISSVSVTVNITHTWQGDLIVEVTSPAGTTERLHDRSGGSADDIHQTYVLPSEFDNESSAGTWTLSVSDNAGADTGTLDDWTLEVTGVDDGGGPPVNNPPTASFTHTTSDLTADFTDTSSDSDGTITSWSWDFGDGNSSSAQNPSHTYASGWYLYGYTDGHRRRWRHRQHVELGHGHRSSAAADHRPVHHRHQDAWPRRQGRSPRVEQRCRHQRGESTATAPWSPRPPTMACTSIGSCPPELRSTMRSARLAVRIAPTWPRPTSSNLSR